MHCERGSPVAEGELELEGILLEPIPSTDCCASDKSGERGVPVDDFLLLGEHLWLGSPVQTFLIRESVDSLCRDGADAQQYMQYLSKSRITSAQIC